MRRKQYKNAIFAVGLILLLVFSPLPFYAVAQQEQLTIHHTQEELAALYEAAAVRGPLPGLLVGSLAGTNEAVAAWAEEQLADQILLAGPIQTPNYIEVIAIHAHTRIVTLLLLNTSGHTQSVDIQIESDTSFTAHMQTLGLAPSEQASQSQPQAEASTQPPEKAPPQNASSDASQPSSASEPPPQEEAPVSQEPTSVADEAEPPATEETAGPSSAEATSISIEALGLRAAIQPTALAFIQAQTLSENIPIQEEELPSQIAPLSTAEVPNAQDGITALLETDGMVALSFSLLLTDPIIVNMAGTYQVNEQGTVAVSQDLGGVNIPLEADTIINITGNTILKLGNLYPLKIQKIISKIEWFGDWARNGLLTLHGPGTLEVDSPDGNAVDVWQLHTRLGAVLNATAPETGIYSENYITMYDSKLSAVGGVNGIETGTYIIIETKSEIRALGGQDGLSIGSGMDVWGGSQVWAEGGRYGIHAKTRVAAAYLPEDIAVPEGEPPSVVYGRGGQRGILSKGDALLGQDIAGGYILAHTNTRIVGEAYEEGSIGIETATNINNGFIKAYGGEVLGTGVAGGIRCNSAGYILAASLLGVPGKVIGTATGVDGIGIESTLPKLNGYIMAQQNSILTGTGARHGIKTANGDIQAHTGGTITAISSQLQQGNPAIFVGKLAAIKPFDMGAFTVRTGSTIHEIYRNAGINFSQTPLNLAVTQPYNTAIGRNMKNIGLYTWSDSLNNFADNTSAGIITLRADGSGLVAASTEANIAVRATRTLDTGLATPYAEPVHIPLATTNNTYMVTLLANTEETGGSETINLLMKDRFLVEDEAMLALNPEVGALQIFDENVAFTLTNTQSGVATVLRSTVGGVTLLQALEPGSYEIIGGTVEGYQPLSNVAFTVNAAREIVVESGPAALVAGNLEVYYSPQLVPHTIALAQRGAPNTRLGGTFTLTARAWQNAYNGPILFPTITTLPGSLPQGGTSGYYDATVSLHPRYAQWQFAQQPTVSPAYYVYENGTSVFGMEKTDTGYQMAGIQPGCSDHHFLPAQQRIEVTNAYSQQRLGTLTVNVTAQRVWNPHGQPAFFVELNGVLGSAAGQKFYAAVTVPGLDKAQYQTFSTTTTQGTGTATFTGLPFGEYTVAVHPTLRFAQLPDGAHTKPVTVAPQALTPSADFLFAATSLTRYSGTDMGRYAFTILPAVP